MYDAIPSKVPGSVPSQGFECCQTTEFGDEVGLARTLALAGRLPFWRGDMLASIEQEERAAAHASTVFTTVSDVTSIEAEKLLVPLLSKLSNIRADSFVETTAKTGLDKPALDRWDLVTGGYVAAESDGGQLPIWVIFSAAAAISLGTWSGGWRIMRTLGRRIKDGARQVRIYVSIPNTERSLVAGLFAEGRVATDSRKAVAVPVSAVDRRGTSPVIHRVKQGKVDVVPVQLGVRDDAAEAGEVARLTGAKIGLTTWSVDSPTIDAVDATRPPCGAGPEAGAPTVQPTE